VELISSLRGGSNLNRQEMHRLEQLSVDFSEERLKRAWQKGRRWSGRRKSKKTERGHVVGAYELNAR